MPNPEDTLCPEIEETEALLAGKAVTVGEGELYVVATPIGRIVDLSLRAIKVLQGVDLIAAEDTRRAYILLNFLGIKKKVVSNQKFNEFHKTEYFLEELRMGKSIAVISDAGTPCISDPGNELIKRAIEEGIKVVPVPGACAAVSAVSVSGFDLRSFLFRGFFPKENSEKKAEIQKYQSGITRTYIYYESPKRILKTIQFFADEKIPCHLCLCNDLTKVHERFYRGSPEAVLAELLENPNAEKGEFTLILELDEAFFAEKESSPLSPEAALCEAMLQKNCSSKEAIELLLQSGAPFRKNELKDAALRLKKCFGSAE